MNLLKLGLLKDPLMRKKELIRVFVRGGILSPGDFYKIICSANALGSDYIHLGSRQDILFPVRKNNLNDLKKTFKDIDTEFDTIGDEYQNIVSSYVGLDVMQSTRWLVPHIYHYMLDLFNYRTRLKINITDPAQSIVPLFTGNLNFVASPTDNYWYLYLRFSEIDPKPWCCPELIYGFDMAKVAKAIEGLNPEKNGFTHPQIYQKIKELIKFSTAAIKTELQYSETIFPYYEGLNRIAGDKYWLGVYWRNNKFTIKFLKALCELCIETNIGKISITPWKSFIVNGIEEKYRVVWEKLLGKYGINIRHSSIELNWHLPVLDEEALELKRYLVRALDQQDISTYGLTFTVKTSGHSVLFTSIVIEKAAKENDRDPDTYNILYAKDFNPNLLEFHYYVKRVSKEIIPSLLIELSKKYYDQLDTHNFFPQEETLIKKAASRKVYQCTNCLTIYDENFGDESAGIEKGISFEQLPDSYECPVCGSPKSSYEEIAQEKN